MPLMIPYGTDYGRPERKWPSLHGQKFNPNPKFLGTAEAYFVCHIGSIFQISLIYAFIGCPQSVPYGYAQRKYFFQFANLTALHIDKIKKQLDRCKIPSDGVPIGQMALQSDFFWEPLGQTKVMQIQKTLTAHYEFCYSSQQIFFSKTYKYFLVK